MPVFWLFEIRLRFSECIRILKEEKQIKLWLSDSYKRFQLEKSITKRGNSGNKVAIKYPLITTLILLVIN